MSKMDLELNTKEIFEIMVENYMGIEKRIEINDDCIQAYESFKEQYIITNRIKPNDFESIIFRLNTDIVLKTNKNDILFMLKYRDDLILRRLLTFAKSNFDVTMSLVPLVIKFIWNVSKYKNDVNGIYDKSVNTNDIKNSIREIIKNDEYDKEIKCILSNSNVSIFNTLLDEIVKDMEANLARLKNRER